MRGSVHLRRFSEAYFAAWEDEGISSSLACEMLVEKTIARTLALFLLSSCFSIGCSGLRCVDQRNETGALFARTCFNKTGSRQGSHKEFGENGGVVFSAEYANDSLNGPLTRYREDGSICYSIEYRMNRIWNVIEQMDRNGSDLPRGSLRNGNGSLFVYDCDGSLKRKGNIVNGLKEGYWSIYGLHGILDSVLYVQGKRGHREEWEILP